MIVTQIASHMSTLRLSIIHQIGTFACRWPPDTATAEQLAECGVATLAVAPASNPGMPSSMATLSSPVRHSSVHYAVAEHSSQAHQHFTIMQNSSIASRLCSACYPQAPLTATVWVPRAAKVHLVMPDRKSLTSCAGTSSAAKPWTGTPAAV